MNTNDQWDKYENEFIEWLEKTISDYEERIKKLKEMRSRAKKGKKIERTDI
jgi:hypothetical protein